MRQAAPHGCVYQTQPERISGSPSTGLRREVYGETYPNRNSSQFRYRTDRYDALRGQPSSDHRARNRVSSVAQTRVVAGCSIAKTTPNSMARQNTGGLSFVWAITKVHYRLGHSKYLLPFLVNRGGSSGREKAFRENSPAVSRGPIQDDRGGDRLNVTAITPVMGKVKFLSGKTASHRGDAAEMQGAA